MSSVFIIHMLKSAVILSVLYGVYHFVFKHNTRYFLKRIILLAILFCALILPAIQLQLETNFTPSVPIAHQIDSIIGSQEHTPTLPTETQPMSGVSDPSTFDWLQALTYMYWAGVGISLCIFIYQLTDILTIILSGRPRHDLGRKLLTHKNIRYPSSFWKWVFLPIGFHINNHEWPLVHAHERAHIQQAHSFDLLCTSLVKCFLWFTPAAYYIQNSIRNNHEFLADEHVLKKYDMQEYSSVLLKACMDADSLDITHSLALKSNLSKRINHMRLPKTSHLKSSLSVSILSICLFLLATQVSLYSQESADLERKDSIFKVLSRNGDGTSFSSLNIYEKTGQYPDTWVNFMVNGWVPIILLDHHKSIMTTFQESNEAENLDGEGERYFRVSLRKTKEPDFSEPEFFESQKNKLRNELLQQLTTQEKLDMYALSKAWAEEYVLPVYPNYSIISELDFIEKNFLVFQSEPSRNNPRKYNVKTVFKSQQVDQLPEPTGGLERYVKSVAKNCKPDPALVQSDLPKKIQFEFTIDQGGNMVLLNLKSKVRGPEQTQKKVYELLKQINDNLIKASDVYGWTPGEKDGEIVATKMTLDIPQSLFYD